MTHTEKELRSAAKEKGVPWSAVEAAYIQIREEELAAREHANHVRQTAWYLATASTPYRQPFWRIGFDTLWGKRYREGDVTAVPGYDEIAQEMATMFSEYDHADGTEDLFDFLFSRYNPMPRRVVMLAKALDRAAHETHQSVTTIVDALEF